jgi:matrixin
MGFVSWTVDLLVYDFHRVAIHEFGHTVGLDHPDQVQPKQTVIAIMNSRVSDLDTLAQDDINGATAIYGTGPAYKTQFQMGRS